MNANSRSLGAAVILGLILNLGTNASAAELLIDADSFAGDSGTQITATGARLSYGAYQLTAGKLIYDNEASFVKASDEVVLTDDNNTRLRADLLDYFPLLQRAEARGNIEFSDASGIKLMAHLLRYEFEMYQVFLEGNLRLADSTGNILFADSLQYDTQTRDAVATGNVRIATSTNITIATDVISYAAGSQLVTVSGAVQVTDAKGMEISGSQLAYDIANASGSLTEVILRTPETESVATGSKLEFAGENYVLTDAIYTSCDIDDPAWLLEADSITVDENKIAHAQNVKLRFGSVPVFYFPRMSYNTSNERRSGFLSPKISLNDDGEFGLELPYYLNLAKNYDAIVTGNYRSTHGIQGIVSGRWLLPNGKGNLEVGGINDKTRDEFRSHWAIQHRHNFANNYYVALDASGLGDDNYGDDFFGDSRSSKRHFLRALEVGQQQTNWNWYAFVADYQTILRSTRPYNRLPGLAANYHDHVGNFQVDSNVSFTKFTREILTTITVTNAGTTQTLTNYVDDPANGNRSYANARVTRDLVFGGSNNLELVAGVAGANYSNPSTNWVVPYASADLRPQFWSNYRFAQRNLRQLFEPRLFLGIVKRDNFTTIPNYDTARVAAGYQDYFAVNSFAGKDRFEDTSFVSYGLDTKLWSDQLEHSWFTGRLAQRYRFKDSQVAAGSETPPESGFSNFIAEARLDPDLRNTYLARAEWNPDREYFEQANLEYQHRSAAGHVYNLRYSRSRRANADDRGDWGAGVVHYLNDNYQVAAVADYDLDSSKFTNIESGIQYTSSCRCWGMNFFVKHEPLALENRTSYYLQIDLRGLGGFGSSNYDQLVSKITTPR